MEILILKNNQLVFTINEISNLTGISNNELRYNIRVLKLQPEKWKNLWILNRDEVVFLLTYLYEIYKLKELKLNINE
jgi:hypothetical protein